MACSTVRLCPIQDLRKVTFREVEEACRGRGKEEAPGLEFLAKKKGKVLQIRETDLVGGRRSQSCTRPRRTLGREGG